MVGGIFIVRLISSANFGIIIPVTLIFYAFALIHVSKYTIGDVLYLGYAFLTLGLINLWMQSLGLLFLALGFGFFHIIYGVATFFIYERHSLKSLRSPKEIW